MELSRSNGHEIESESERECRSFPFPGHIGPILPTHSLALLWAFATTSASASASASGAALA
jgi:hypothetical protein